MSTLEQLVQQWCQLSEQADEIEITIAALERDGAEAAVIERLQEVEATTSARIGEIDARIADTPPASLADAAILAAFALRAHNENDLMLSSEGTFGDERAFDEALSKVLANLVAYLGEASKAELGEIKAAWCLPCACSGAAPKSAARMN